MIFSFDMTIGDYVMHHSYLDKNDDIISVQSFTDSLLKFNIVNDLVDG